MKCLILAAGYATRLYPLTQNFPKPLLKVADKPILDWLIDDLATTGAIDEYIVVTNHRFAHFFEEWAAGHKEKVTVVDDGTSSNETRLGAVIDIQFAVDRCGIDDDLLVMAGDNLLSFSLSGFIDYWKEKGSSCIMRYWESDEARLHKSGVVEVDEEGLVLSMEEKPAQPKSHWCCPPFYLYNRSDIGLLADAIAAGCGTDAPGSLPAWLCTIKPVHAWEMPGPRYDIGTLESYEAVQKEFRCPIGAGMTDRL